MSTTSAKNIFRGFAHLLAALFSNAAQFNKQWRQYRPVPQSNQDIQGCWIGEWVSKTNGHHGSLKCILTQMRPGQYRASVYATHAKLLRVCYDVCLDAQEKEGHIVMKWEADLGALAGGAYHYEGEATPSNFECAYSCQYDQGSFRMKRLD